MTPDRSDAPAVAMSPELRAFVGYRVISRLYFHLAVLFPYFWLAGLSLPVVAAALAAYGLAITIVAPWANSVLGARSELEQILMGEALKATGLVVLVVSPSPVGAILGQVVGGIGYALTAGPDTRLLRRLAPDAATFDRIQANTQSYMFLSILVSGIVGALLYAVDNVLPFVATLVAAPFAVFALLLAARRLPIAPVAPPTPDVRVTERPQLTSLTTFWVNYYALSRGVLLGVYLGALPYLFFLIEKVDVAYFGATLGVFTLLAFIAARNAIAVSRRVGVPQTTLATLALMVCGFALFAATESLATSIFAMGLLGLANGGVRPLTLSHIAGQELSPGERLRALSIMEQRNGVLNSAVILVSGVALGYGWLSFRELMVLIVVAFVLVVAALFVLRHTRSRKSTSSPDGEPDGHATRTLTEQPPTRRSAP